MKRLTLFPKTFLASISMLAAMIVIAHGLIYLLMPAVYLQQKQQAAAVGTMSSAATLPVALRCAITLLSR